MKKILPWLAFAGCIFILIRSQFSIPNIWEADGYLHARMADMLWTDGIVKKFPWARYSLFNDRFADKDILYHALLIPFIKIGSIFYGAKVAACFFAVLLLVVYWWILRQVCKDWRLQILFTVLFLISGHFLSALNRPRTMVPAIALMLVGIQFILQKRRWPLAIITFLYGLMHITALLMLASDGTIQGIHLVPAVPGLNYLAR